MPDNSVGIWDRGKREKERAHVFFIFPWRPTLLGNAMIHSFCLAHVLITYTLYEFRNAHSDDHRHAYDMYVTARTWPVTLNVIAPDDRKQDIAADWRYQLRNDNCHRERKREKGSERKIETPVE